MRHGRERVVVVTRGWHRRSAWQLTSTQSESFGTHPARRRSVMRYSRPHYGYVIAGAALEHLAATSWEELMRVRLFGPLEMNECDGSASSVFQSLSSQPWGHDVLQ